MIDGQSLTYLDEFADMTRRYRRGVTTTDIVSPEQADRKETSLRVPPLAYPGSEHRAAYLLQRVNTAAGK
jgi:hypothetical protein